MVYKKNYKKIYKKKYVYKKFVIFVECNFFSLGHEWQGIACKQYIYIYIENKFTLYIL